MMSLPPNKHSNPSIWCEFTFLNQNFFQLSHFHGFSVYVNVCECLIARSSVEFNYIWTLTLCHSRSKISYPL